MIPNFLISLQLGSKVFTSRIFLGARRLHRSDARLSMLGFHFPALSALQEDDGRSFHSELPTENHVVSTVMI